MANVLAAYMQGQQAVEANKRNKLLQMAIDSAPADKVRADRTADLEYATKQQTYDTNQLEIDSAKQKQGLSQGIAAAGYIIDSQSPKREAETRYPEVVQQMRQQGIDWDSLRDDDVRQIASEFRNQLSAKGGIAPAERFERVEGPRGSVIERSIRTGGLKQVVGPDNTETRQPAAKSTFRALTPAEVEAAGLPAGSSAQRDEQTGEIKVLSKKDATNSLSQKDSTTAKIKLNQLKVARQQIQNARDRFAKIRNTIQAGPGQLGSAPTELGRQFDKSIDQLRGSITAITRVPGVGSMSDYESKLDQSKFPERSGYESVTEQQLNDLEQQLDTIEQGYTGLLAGGQQTGGATGNFGPAQNAAPQVSDGAIARNPKTGQRIQYRNGQWVPLAN